MVVNTVQYKTLKCIIKYIKTLLVFISFYSGYSRSPFLKKKIIIFKIKVSENRLVSKII